MMKLPWAAPGARFVAWRLHEARFAESWDSGEGAFRFGGRWNRKGMRAVYCSLDPATAILEAAVHRTFKALDTVPHVLTSLTVEQAAGVHVVMSGDVPNANWLRPGIPSDGQMGFGDQLLRTHRFVLIPSAVSGHSWNLVFESGLAAGAYALDGQERFALDTRLNPPAN